MAGKREFGGTEHFKSPPARVYAVLTDLGSLRDSIPDLVSAQLVDDTTLQCVVRPGFSFLRGTLKLEIKVQRTTPDRAADMSIQAQGIGVQLRVESRLALESEGEGTQLDWTAKIVEMKGLVATVSPGLVSAAADQVIRHAWQQVRTRLGE